MADVVRRLAADDPFLAGVAGDADALATMALVAWGPQLAEGSVNLTVRRVALGAERLTDLRSQVVDLLAAEYAALGFEPQPGPAGLRTDEGLPIAALAYAPAAASAARGRQYFVATDSDLWILTFTSAGESAEQTDLFERIAASFAPR